MKDSPTSEIVKEFAESMEYKLSINRHKGDRPGWLKHSVEELLKRLDEEVAELKDAVINNSPPIEAEFEAADVANIAMIISDIYSHKVLGE